MKPSASIGATAFALPNFCASAHLNSSAVITFCVSLPAADKYGARIGNPTSTNKAAANDADARFMGCLRRVLIRNHLALNKVLLFVGDHDVVDVVPLRVLTFEGRST